jgi:carboxyl-terminal processing protease
VEVVRHSEGSPALLLALSVLAAVACAASDTASVGAVLGRDNETHAVHVREVPEGMAAAKAGLVPGDEILMIDGFYVKELGIKQIHALLRGEPGTTVELTVARGQGDIRRVRVTRSALRARVEKKEEKIQE